MFPWSPSCRGLTTMIAGSTGSGGGPPLPTASIAKLINSNHAASNYQNQPDHRANHARKWLCQTCSPICRPTDTPRLPSRPNLPFVRNGEKRVLVTDQSKNNLLVTAFNQNTANFASRIHTTTSIPTINITTSLYPAL